MPVELANKASSLIAIGVIHIKCFDWVRIQVQIVGLEEESSEFICRNTFDHPYPTTKIMWIPDTKGVYPDLLATSGDYLRIWRVSAFCSLSPRS